MLARRVLVVGAGIGGLAAGATLGGRGAEVQIVEIDEAHEVLGVGINQPANSLRALRSIGVLDDVLARGFEFDGSRFCDAAGDLIVESLPKIKGDVPANVALTRGDLQEILFGAAERAGSTIRRGVTVSELSQDERQVHVTFTDGRQDSFDLVVAFDGIKSATRRRIFGDAYEPVFTGHSVWRVTLPRPPEIGCTWMFQGCGTKAGVIPLNEREMYLFHVTTEPGNPRFDPAKFDVLLKERMAEYTGLPGELRDAIGGPEGIVYSPLSEVLLPLPWHRGRVVVLGDAAHAFAPHLTQGAGMAIEDAVVLADVLDGDQPLEAALTAFGERRWPRCKLVHDASHRILFSEMAANEETLPALKEHLRRTLSSGHNQLDTILLQSA